MINYAIPKKVNLNTSNKKFDNRGMLFEEAINKTNNYYLEIDKAVIYKKPTPVHIVKIDNSDNRAKISEAFFEQPSTTDYNGIYKGKYIDFEAKETRNKTSFPLSNIYEHQVKHLDLVRKHGGISFLLIRFSTLDEIYLVDSSLIYYFYFLDEKKSIPYQVIKEKGYLVKYGYLANVDYLAVVEQVYFK